MSAEARELDHLAKRCGIQATYRDGMGVRRRAPIEAVMAALRAMGHEVRTPADAREENQRLDAIEAQKACEPVIVKWQRGRSASRAVLGPGRAREQAASPRQRTAEHVDLPDDLPIGIHRITVGKGKHATEATVLHAPARCFHRRSARTAVGVFLPLYAVRSQRNWGVGDLTDLAELVEWAGAAGCSLFGTLPLLACFLDKPFDPSPYAPISRVVFSEMFLDLERAASRLPDGGELHRFLTSAQTAQMAEALRKADLVDYRECWRLKRRGLEAATRDVFASDRLRAEVNRFEWENPLIGEYARFRGGMVENGAAHVERQLFLCAQWLLTEQLQRLADERRDASCGLYLDLPVGAHGSGFDAQRHPDLFAPGVALGAPPDGFFKEGQNWGFPPVIPEVSRASGHAWFVESVAHHLRLAAALRIDHAAGLHRTFWIPDGMSATEGLYVHKPAEEYYAVLSVLSHLHEATIIGEDLGTVPQDIRRALSRRRVGRMSIAQFELGDPRCPVPDPEPGMLAALNTHDMPPFASFWRGDDLALHARLGLIEGGQVEPARHGREQMRQRVAEALGVARSDDADREAHEVLAALLRHLAGSRAELLMISLEDLWLETQPQNVPGIVDGYPNWRRKAAQTLEWITGPKGPAALIHSLGAINSRR